jgi:hypothetical protein
MRRRDWAGHDGYSGWELTIRLGTARQVQQVRKRLTDGKCEVFERGEQIVFCTYGRLGFQNMQVLTQVGISSREEFLPSFFILYWWLMIICEIACCGHVIRWVGGWVDRYKKRLEGVHQRPLRSVRDRRLLISRPAMRWGIFTKALRLRILAWDWRLLGGSLRAYVRPITNVACWFYFNIKSVSANINHLLWLHWFQSPIMLTMLQDLCHREANACKESIICLQTVLQRNTDKSNLHKKKNV